MFLEFFSPFADRDFFVVIVVGFNLCDALRKVLVEMV